MMTPQAKPGSKTVGVLGGMGPYAAAAFFKLLLDLTPAKKEWDHLRVIIDSNPHIPSRTRHLLYGETSPVEGMLESCRRLEKYPVDLIAIPCNSAAVFIPEIQPHLRVPVLNICEVTANALAATHPSSRRVAVLGGYVTYKRQSYKPFLAKHGMEWLDHGEEIQRQVEQLIATIKLHPAQSANARAMEAIVATLCKKWQADIVILACTEFACLSGLALSVPSIDSTKELAQYTVKFATP